MAVSRVSPRNPDSISTLSKSCQEKLGVHPTGARHPDGSNVWRILQATNAGEIRCAVRTPVAKEGNYLWLPVYIFCTRHNLCLPHRVPSTAILQLFNHCKNLLVLKAFEIDCP
jgi:hypothetical protein